MRKICFKSIFFIFIFFSAAGWAQTAERPFIIDGRVHSGLSLPFYKALSYLNQDDVYALEVSVGLPGQSYWDKLYNYPLTGFGFSAWSPGNKEILGKAYSLFYFMNFPLIKKSDKFSLDYRLSYGAAYLTKKFDRYDNPLNRAIGSHFNIYLRLGINARIRILPRSDLVLEAGAVHFSNGKTKSPNIGINAASFSAGVSHLFGNMPKVCKDAEIPELEKRTLQSVTASAGMKVYDNLLDHKYLTSSVAYNFEYLLNHKRKIGLGADLSYDKSIKEGLANEEMKTDIHAADLFRVGLHVSYSTRYKNLIMGIQEGHYIYSKFTVLTSLYTKLSVQYLFTGNLSGIVAIKSHFGKADCLEWGLACYL